VKRREVGIRYTRITLPLPKSLVNEIPTSTDRIGAGFDVISGYDPLGAWVDTASSRDALLFVANHCVNKLLSPDKQ